MTARDGGRETSKQAASLIGSNWAMKISWNLLLPLFQIVFFSLAIVVARWLLSSILSAFVGCLAMVPFNVIQRNWLLLNFDYSTNPIDRTFGCCAIWRSRIPIQMLRFSIIHKTNQIHNCFHFERVRAHVIIHFETISSFLHTVRSWLIIMISSSIAVV